MLVLPRTAVAVLAGLAAAAALAVPLAGQADAATSTVWIVQKQQTNHGPVETALRTAHGSFAGTSLVTGGSRRRPGRSGSNTTPR